MYFYVNAKNICKKAGRKAKWASANDTCRFCNSNLKAVCESEPYFILASDEPGGNRNRSIMINAQHNVRKRAI